MNEITHIERILKSIFGEIEFYELKKFFQDLHSKNVDLIIFTTRRSHLLYCMFRKYFFKNIKKKCKYIIDDKAIHFYDKQIKNKNCAIVDDIMIHGRALFNIVERLQNKDPKDIQIYVYAKGKETLYFQEEYFNKLNCVKSELERHEWEYLSNQIVAALLLTSTSYASYIFSFSKKLSEKEFQNLLNDFETKFSESRKMDLSLEEVDNNSTIGEILNKNLECYIFNAKDYSKINNLVFSCFRVYYNKILKTCTVIPFVITREMTKDNVNDIIVKLFPKRSKIAKTDCVEAKYRAITAFFSIRLFFSEFGLIKFMSWNTNTQDICMSYYKRFYNDLIIKITILKNHLFNIQSHSFVLKNYNIKDLKSDIYLKALKVASEKPNKLNVFYDTSNLDALTLLFYKYLTYVNYKEEKYFSEQLSKKIIPEKQKGLSFSTFNNFFNKSNKINLSNGNFSMFDFYSKFIESSDTGFLTIFIDKYHTDKKTLYSNFFITGEQVCRLYQNQYIIFICKLNDIYNEYKKHHNSVIDFSELVKFCADNSDFQYSSKIKSAYEYLNNKNFDPFILNSIYKTITDEKLNLILMKGVEKLKQSNV